MKIHPNRIQKLNTHNYQDGPVVYWMNRDQRAHDNWALLYAQELALEHKAPLLVVFNLDPGFLGGGYRQHAFKVKGLQEVAETFEKKNIPFFVKEGQDTEKQLITFLHDVKAGALVTDFFPLHLPRKWGNYIRKQIEIPFFRVDAHNIIPCWVVSEKQEFAARTIRPKIHKNLKEYLTDYPRLKKHPHDYRVKSKEGRGWQEMLDNPKVDTTVTEIDWLKPGEKAAKKVWRDFLENKLPTYAVDRNDPNIDGQSNLSAYFHFGQLSPQRVAWEVVQQSRRSITSILSADRNGSGKGGTNEAAFLEEMVVRRELSDNFCFYNENYDTYDGFPEWARISLEQHMKDRREYVYTRKQFEKAETHDDLWNAAQREMMHHGKMHGYMRMYWAKKILEWASDPEEAMKIAVYLNDKYEIDGRDPNGYVGCAWSIGGLHDRPWFERPIFGKVRYMNKNGCKKKFDVSQYIEKILNTKY